MSQQYGLHRFWWLMLETKCVGDKFEILVTDLHWENHQHNEKSRQHNDSAWQNLPPTSQISHRHKITNITVTHVDSTIYVVAGKYKWNTEFNNLRLISLVQTKSYCHRQNIACPCIVWSNLYSFILVFDTKMIDFVGYIQYGTFELWQIDQNYPSSSANCEFLENGPKMLVVIILDFNLHILKRIFGNKIKLWLQNVVQGEQFLFAVNHI